MSDWQEHFARMPLIAILRGVRPVEVISVVEGLARTGFRIVEVPLNSPEPLESISRLAQAFGRDLLIGAGTVLAASEVHEVAEAGGRLIVAPNLDESVAAAAHDLSLTYCPGVQTATEAFRGLQLGARALKLFPAEAIPPAAVKALRAVLPADCQLIPVGGITPEAMASYRAAGAAGFGLGSALYQPGKELPDILVAARAFAAAASEAASSSFGSPRAAR
jgi:2-dehydro-3-deoxyphosphogalactonate aldolase